MKFTANGKEYALEFKRQTMNVVRGGGEYVDTARHPFTYAIVREVIEGERNTEKWPVAYSAFVGCHPSDRYTPEGGRWASLKRLCRMSTVPPEVKKGVWEAFLGRLDETSTKHMSNKRLRQELAKTTKALHAALNMANLYREKYERLMRNEEE